MPTLTGSSEVISETVSATIHFIPIKGFVLVDAKALSSVGFYGLAVNDRQADEGISGSRVISPRVLAFVTIQGFEGGIGSGYS